MAKRQRPLSPHLMIYRPQITSVLSITHRATGVALTFGALLFSYWLISVSYGPEAFESAQNLLGSWIGQLVLIGVLFAMYYHLGNGIRHLVWDAGKGFELNTLRKTGMAVIAFAVLMTALTLAAIYA